MKSKKRIGFVTRYKNARKSYAKWSERNPGKHIGLSALLSGYNVWEANREIKKARQVGSKVLLRLAQAQKYAMPAILMGSAVGQAAYNKYKKKKK